MRGGPRLHLRTLYELDACGRILCTREPGSSAGPLFTLIRSREELVWAAHAGIPDSMAEGLAAAAAAEVRLEDWRDRPSRSENYRMHLSPLGPLRASAGPALEFGPDCDPAPDAPTALVDDLGLLLPHFPGWTGDEMPGRWPIVAVVEDGAAVSVCCSARWSGEAAEAGVETALHARGRGLAGAVCAAWARAVRRSGRLPLYSTDWGNTASRRVAAKLGLRIYAASWSLHRAD